MHAELKLFDTTYAALALSTTGLRPDKDRVIEIAVAVIGRESRKPKLVFETLVRSDVPITNDDLHELKTEDLRGAPSFDEVRDGLLAVLANRLTVVHNPIDSLAFLQAEFERLGSRFEVPYLATMELDRDLGSARQSGGSVSSVAMANDVKLKDQSAASRALATAGLLRRYLLKAKREGANTVDDLLDVLKGAPPEFAGSLELPMLMTQAVLIPEKLVARPERLRSAPSPRARYLGELLVAAADLKLEADELETIRKVRDEIALPDDEIRAIHAAVFAAALERYNEDRTIDEFESQNLKRLADMLTKLGWCPGDSEAEIEELSA